MGRQKERVEGYIKAGLAEGARLATGGGTPEAMEKGFYFELTVFTDVTPEMTISRKEIFGPVASIITYSAFGPGVKYLLGDACASYGFTAVYCRI